jgi:serine/threonine-protein kinase
MKTSAVVWAALFGLTGLPACGGTAMRSPDGGGAATANGGASTTANGGAVVTATGGAIVTATGGAIVTATGGTGTTPGSGLFPASAPWYQDVSKAALDAESAQVIAGLQAKGGWGAGSFRIDFSIELLHADASITPRAFTKTDDFYDTDCDFVPVPVPPGGRLEGETNYVCASDGDCHLLVVQGSKLYEMWRADIGGGSATGTPFNGGCLAVWDLTRNYWVPASPPAPFSRGDQCTSADAAGYPIAALLFSADEVKYGALNHAIRFILPNDRIRKGAYVHPATHSGVGKGTPTADLVPYGAHFRLKASFDLSKLPNEGARTVARALQRYGMFLADGGNIALTAQADTTTTAKWDGLLGSQDLKSILVTDFDMVDGGQRIPLTLDCVRTAM